MVSTAGQVRMIFGFLEQLELLRVIEKHLQMLVYEFMKTSAKSAATYLTRQATDACTRLVLAKYVAYWLGSDNLWWY